MVLLARFDLIEYDFDHDMLVSVSTGLDAHLERVRQYANHEDADTWDVLHDIDNIVGLGFTAAQTYLTSVSRALRMRRTEAISRGPKHAGGFTIAQIVNEAANFWKHRDEWEEEATEAPRDKRRARTIEVLSAAGVDLKADYPLSSLLERLKVATVRNIADALIPWRDHLWLTRKADAHAQE
jgi:hypothetical protein